jgi:hypothetical protein
MRAAFSLLLALCACDRPETFVMCHNANCTSLGVEYDDTRRGLAEAFALTYDGKPALDGIEWDTFWYGAESRCLFAHDLNNDTSTDANVAATDIANYLAGAQVASWNGERFYTFIELKGFVGESFSDAHTPAQRAQHAGCALDVLETIAAGARAGGHRLTVGFVAGVPALHEALVADPRWEMFTADPELELMLVGDIFAPYSGLVPELHDYKLPLDAVEYHPDYMTVQHRETYRSLGIELVQWSFISSREAFAAIGRWEPGYVVSNEALLLRRWLER